MLMILCGVASYNKHNDMLRVWHVTVFFTCSSILHWLDNGLFKPKHVAVWTGKMYVVFGLRIYHFHWIYLALDNAKWRPVTHTQYSKCRLRKMRGISWQAEELLASQEWLCCMEWSEVEAQLTGHSRIFELHSPRFVSPALTALW